MNLRSSAPRALALGALLLGTSVDASDHLDPGMPEGDAASDLTDFYAWHTDDSFVVVVGFAGLQMPGTDPVFDDGVLYSVHIDRDADNESDVDIHVRFGQNADGEWGVQVENLPGTDGPVIGAVETILEAGGAQVWAGTREDPFFFDFEGYNETLAEEEILFDPDRDSFAGTNVSAIVLEMDLEEASGGETSIQSWVTAHRKGS